MAVGAFVYFDAFGLYEHEVLELTEGVHPGEPVLEGVGLEGWGFGLEGLKVGPGDFFCPGIFSEGQWPETPYGEGHHDGNQSQLQNGPAHGRFKSHFG